MFEVIVAVNFGETIINSVSMRAAPTAPVRCSALFVCSSRHR
jgi:hypothetical protein